MWEHNCFVTLTFAPENIPASGSISRRDLQLFMKRLREFYEGSKIRFFACGEYTQQNVPHYHILLFNHFFPDQKLHSKKKSYSLFISPTLQKLWPYGFSTIGTLNYKTAGYTAQYSIKKITGDRALEHYTRPHPITGAIIKAEPEFIQMSTRPGIGYSWFQKFKSDCYPSDFLINDGRKFPVPKYYDKLLTRESLGDDLLHDMKRERQYGASKQRADNTPQRLAVREECAEARVKLQPRPLGEKK